MESLVQTIHLKPMMATLQSKAMGSIRWKQHPNNTPVYQGFNVEDYGLSAGDHVVAYGSMMSHADDWIGNGANSAYYLFQILR